MELDYLLPTNDPFNRPQLVINNNGFSSYNDNGEIIVKSKWSSIELDNFQNSSRTRRYKINSDNKFK